MSILEIETELVYLNQQLKRKPTVKHLKRLEHLRYEHARAIKEMRK